MEIADVVQLEARLVDFFSSSMEADFWISGMEMERILKIEIKQSQ